MQFIITGSSGFLGGIITSQLSDKHRVITVGRSPGNEVVCDLAETIPTLPRVDMVVHAAGKAHVVPKNAQEAAEFFRTNVNGTANLLKALEKNLPATFVFISTVAVYGCDQGDLITESHQLNATDPYGKSKIEAESLVQEWGIRNNVKVVILRLPLIFGNNPPGNLGSMINAIRKGYYFRIGTGKARRSVVKAKDVAQLIPKLTGKQGIFNLTDGYHPMVSEIENCIATYFNRKIRSIPGGLARTLALAGDLIPASPFNSRRWQKLTQSLTFSDNSAREQLNWSPETFNIDFIKY